MIFEGERQAVERAHNSNISNAWHVVAIGRAKNFPRLETLMIKPKPKPQTWQEQMAVMGQWAAVMARVEAAKIRK